jgi:hypothetical protein
MEIFMQYRRLILLLVLLVSIFCSCEKAHTHDFSGSYSADDTNHWRECSCGDKGDAEEHKWNNGSVTLKPTVDSREKKPTPVRFAVRKRLRSLISLLRITAIHLLQKMMILIIGKNVIAVKLHLRLNISLMKVKSLHSPQKTPTVLLPTPVSDVKNIILRLFIQSVQTAWRSSRMPAIS